MFQRFTSVLFGDSLEEGSGCPADPDFNEKEEDDEWILVDYLAKACSGACGDDLEVCHDDVAPLDPSVRCSSCSSLDSVADTDAEDGNFLHLEATCGLEESWFITPPPCFMAGGRAPVLLETSPLENLLIEHPSMSVYVSPGPLPAMEESATSLAGSISRMSESALPAVTRSSLPTRVTRGAAAQAGALAKVTQVSRVQRAKARTERRHLGRNRMQRQNRVREQVQRRATHTRNSFLHQPCQRNICH